MKKKNRQVPAAEDEKELASHGLVNHEDPDGNEEIRCETCDVDCDRNWKNHVKTKAHKRRALAKTLAEEHSCLIEDHSGSTMMFCQACQIKLTLNKSVVEDHVKGTKHVKKAGVMADSKPSVANQAENGKNGDEHSSGKQGQSSTLSLRNREIKKKRQDHEDAGTMVGTEDMQPAAKKSKRNSSTRSSPTEDEHTSQARKTTEPTQTASAVDQPSMSVASEGKSDASEAETNQTRSIGNSSRQMEIKSQLATELTSHDNIEQDKFPRRKDSSEAKLQEGSDLTSPSTEVGPRKRPSAPKTSSGEQKPKSLSKVNGPGPELDENGCPIAKPSETGAALRSLLLQGRSKRAPRTDVEEVDFIPLVKEAARESDEDSDLFGSEVEDGEWTTDEFIQGDIPPWVMNESTSTAIEHSADPLVALHYEILDFERYMSPTMAEHNARKDLIEKVSSCVFQLWPHARIEVFGSFATGLYLPSSDVDICVMDLGDNGQSHLQELAEAIRDKDFVKRIRVIENAKVPLVKIVDRSSSVQCDISFGTDNGPRNVPLIKKYLTEYPGLRSLLLVIKCFLHQRGLNEVYKGGLGSYAVFLLVTSHLQMWHKNFPLSKANLGSALLDFFSLYSSRFNFVTLAIRIRDGGGYFQKDEQYEGDASLPDLLSIEDPQDSTNELCKNSFSIMSVRRSFSYAESVLRGWSRQNPGNNPTALNCILRVDSLIWSRRNYVAAEKDMGKRD